MMRKLSPLWKNRMILLNFKVKTPFLMLTNPSVVESSISRSVIKVPLTWITRNSWKTMFFGAIASGVDLTGGWAGFLMAEKYPKIGILYKDMSIQFKRRVDEDLHLVCADGEKIQAACDEAVATKQRVNVPIAVDGYCYGYSKEKPVVEAQLTLSIKEK